MLLGYEDLNLLSCSQYMDGLQMAGKCTNGNTNNYSSHRTAILTVDHLIFPFLKYIRQLIAIIHFILTSHAGSENSVVFIAKE